MAEMASGRSKSSQLLNISEIPNVEQEQTTTRSKNGKTENGKNQKKPEKTRKNQEKTKKKTKKKPKGWPEPAGAGQTGQTGQNVRCGKT